MRGLFITGTDTGVGKTYVTAALARLWRRQGCRVAASKPVATGVVGGEFGEDTLLLAEASGLRPAQVTRWSFPDPVAPPVAARRQGVTLSLSGLVEAVLDQGRQADVVLVEGVGGLLCPVTEHGTVADLAAALALPIVVVARRSLGTLNHTLLTLEAARVRGLPVAGVVVNETCPPHSLAEETNVDELRRRLTVLAVVPYQATAESVELNQLATALRRVATLSGND